MVIEIISDHIPIRNLAHLNLKLTEKLNPNTRYRDLSGYLGSLGHCYKTNNPEYIMFWGISEIPDFPNIPSGAGVYKIKRKLKIFRGDL